jgi:hypothetical protein
MLMGGEGALRVQAIFPNSVCYEVHLFGGNSSALREEKMPVILGLRFNFQALEQREEVSTTHSLDCEHPRTDPTHKFCPTCGKEFGRTTTTSETRITLRPGFRKVVNPSAHHQVYSFAWKEKEYLTYANVRSSYRGNYEYFLVLEEAREGMIDLFDTPSREELLSATGALEYGIYDLAYDP